MNPAFYIIVAICIVFIWFGATQWYVPIGTYFKNLFSNFKNKTSLDIEENNEENKE